MSATDTRTCPACSTMLEPFDHEGVELDRCPAGCGLWLDRGELPQVVRSEHSPRDEQERVDAVAAAARDIGTAVVAGAAGERRACAVCGEAMRCTEYAASGVAIDQCRHGIWLDAGELGQIEAYAEGIRSGSLTASGGAVRGIEIPSGILATISRAAVPVPPPAAPGC